jgi:uncharacterized protein YbjT (DUF2867 family)
MFLITGASGTIGSEVLRQLVAQGNMARAMTRSPQAFGTPIDVVQGDFEKPESLAEAVDGVESVFLLTAPGPWVPEHDRAMVEAARAAGVRKIVKLSAIGGSSDELPGSWHVAGEQAVRDSGLAWTILRPAGFASNALRWAPMVRAGQPIPNPTGSGRHAFVDPRDVAAVAVETLPLGSYDGEVLTLTGPELLSVPDQAAQLSAVLRREVDVVDVPPSITEEQMLAAGFHQAVVTVALQGAELIRTGGAETLTTDIQRVLDRRPGTFSAWLETNRAAFA